MKEKTELSQLFPDRTFNARAKTLRFLHQEALGICVMLLPFIVTGLLIAWWVSHLYRPWFPEPELGTVEFRGETVEWNGGTVGVCDYSTNLGPDLNRVEWHHPNGQFRILVEAGEAAPRISISEDQSLIVKYVDRCSHFDSEFAVETRFDRISR